MTVPARMAADRRPAHARVDAVVAGVDDHLRAQRIGRRAHEAAAVVLAVHRLDGEVVAEAAGVGQRAALAAALCRAHTAHSTAGGGVPVVRVSGAVGITLVGECEQLQTVIVVEVPVQLGAPEPVARLAGRPRGATGVGVARAVVPLLEHGEQEQLVLHDRSGSPDVGLAEGAPVLAGAVIDRHRIAVRIGVVEQVIIGRRAPGFRLEGHFDTALELVAARARHRIDHATGTATEFHRVTAGLDLEFLEERERRSGEALATVEVGDVQAIDEYRVLGHRRAAEGNAAEAGVAADHARCEQGDRAEILRHRQAGQFLTVDGGGRLRRTHVHAVDHARTHHLHGVEVHHAAVAAQVDGGGAAQRDVDGHGFAHILAVALDLQLVVTHRQLAQAVAAVAAHRHRARRARGGVGDHDLVARARTAGDSTGRALRHRQGRHRRQAGAQRHAQCRLLQNLAFHPRSLLLKMVLNRVVVVLRSAAPVPGQHGPFELVIPLVEVEVPAPPLHFTALQVDRL